jgi:hypothetical protein
MISSIADLLICVELQRFMPNPARKAAEGCASRD